MNEQTDRRLPPHSDEAEQGVLGCLLQGGAEVMDGLTEQFRGQAVFYDPRHQAVFDAAARLHKDHKPVDALMVFEMLRAMGKDEAVGAELLGQVQDRTPSPANWPAYAVVVWEQFLLRQYLRVCAEASVRIQSGTLAVRELADDLERDLLGLNERRSDSVEYDAAGLVRQSLDYLERFQRGVGIAGGIKTGFSYFDKMTTGLHPAQMIVVASRPGLGKTSFLMNVVEHLAGNGTACGIFSLEMTASQLGARLMFQKIDGDFQRFRTGFLTNDDLQKLTVAGAQIPKWPLIVDDTAGLTVMEIRAKARRWVRRHGVKFIGIDYLQLVRPTRAAANREQEVAEVSVGLKALAKELSVPFMVLAQLNREIDRDRRGGEGSRHHRRPELSDLRESGQVEQDADLVMIFYEPKLRDYEEEQMASADWSRQFKRINGCICKQREGPTGDCEFLYARQSMKFRDYQRPKDGQPPLPTNEEMNL